MEMSQLTEILLIMQSAADKRISTLKENIKKKRPNSSDVKKLIVTKTADLIDTEKKQKNITETTKWFLDNKKYFPTNNEVSNEILEFLQRIGPLGYYIFLEVARENRPDLFPKEATLNI